MPSPEGQVNAVTFLECGLLPNSLKSEDYTSSWTLPSREMLSYPFDNSDPRLLITQGPSTFPSHGELPSTVLIIQKLSYLDAGNYTCSVQNSSQPESTGVSAKFTLRLLCK